MASTAVEILGAETGEVRHSLALGGALSALGAASVVVTSAFYVASPPAAAGPVQPMELTAAMAGAVSGAATLHAAGTVGIFGDIVWAVAALLLAQAFGRHGRDVGAAGWFALFLSILLFTFIDGMTGYVFPPLARSGDAAAFEGLKRLWDMLFLLGTVAYAGGALAILADDQTSQRHMVGPRLAWAAMLVAVIGALGAVAGFAGITALPIDKIAGASIGLGAALFTPISLQIARTGKR